MPSDTSWAVGALVEARSRRVERRWHIAARAAAAVRTDGGLAIGL